MPEDLSTAQQQVANFLDENEMHAPPAYRLLDLAAEVGEVAADTAKSSEYGDSPGSLSVPTDELGDALFALLALADELDVDAGDALETSLSKYGSRSEEAGDAGSGA
ncbi:MULTISPECIES: MazG nucleotide pyrophosphohydrolase domain-containing protein [Halolamina]|uniref:MazG nucleotide pyrophosphohydrolase domain-containing protein n=1 Tax=Halolamina pelagica TaxID=699431 RepID=A0A1I5R4J4_9EURY|nr:MULTISPECIES: MazG nucleotide pyrophosphohydrolase domain-containing protein [Halolamina]NHX35678.1 nucleotide pyrophosphohydrolase [Halolamina sp. R1-12]SFP53267.1 MazG nucleotide pyrophosphohydrolase domain-containing protein [Halolamina pelagica]